MRLSATRNVGIDVLRAIAILTVIALHWVNASVAGPAASTFDRIFVLVAGHGTYGVTLFFILSGFLITRMTMDRESDIFALSARDFYVRRIARIQPLFIAIVALGLVIMEFNGRDASPIYQYSYRDLHATFGGEFLASLFTFTYNWERILHRDAFMFRGLHWDVMWSLAVEEQFYLAFPLFILWARRPRRLCAVLVATVVMGITVRVVCDAARAGFLVRFFNSFVCFDTLALGALLALLTERLPHRRSLSIAATALGATLIAAALYRGGVAWLILGALLFIHGVHHYDVFAPWAKPLAHIGRLSYGLYLLQASAIYLTARFLLGGSNVVVGFIVVAGIAYLFAALSFELWETPMNAWIRARLLRRTMPDSDLLPQATR
jgi:peptidoglycan/LPS O-acetylase OafA/YrhL